MRFKFIQLLIVCILSFLTSKAQTTTYPKLKADSNLFSYKINPTGNPIGGGWGYNSIYIPSKCTYVVKNKEELKAKLLIAKPGEVIYVYDTCTIDLSGETLKIPKGVTLASGRGKGTRNGALLFSNSLHPENSLVSMLTTAGDSVTITGLRLLGPSPDMWDHDFTRGVANAIMCRHANLTVHNCEIWAWNKWAIWLYYSKNAYIHHNYIHHTILAGYGYPIWCGGNGSEKNSYALIEANLFEAGRHTIASSGHLNSWEARYNVLLRRQLYTNLDRHDQGSSGYGGKSIKVFRNLFFTTQQHYGFAEPADTSGTIEIFENYFRRDSASTGGVSHIAHGTTTDNPKVIIKNNFYNGQGISLPQAKIAVSTISGTAPLKVVFNASESIDTNNIAITKYMWRFGDGDYRGNESREVKKTYTFSQPGKYNVTLVVFNAYGIPSEPEQITITVLPKPTLYKGKYILSAWMKDTYPDTLTGRYEKQILVDNKIVWTDDVAGNEGWQHVVLDISSAGPLNSQHRIAIRLYSKNGVTDYTKEICELFLWVDDVHVFNTTMSNNSFENAKPYPPWNQAFYVPPGAANVSTAHTTEERRSGEKSFRIRFAYSGKYPPGEWGEIYQYVIFK